jgi:hypothetical protein
MAKAVHFTCTNVLGQDKYKRDFTRHTSNVAPMYGKECAYVEEALGVPVFYAVLIGIDPL